MRIGMVIALGLAVAGAPIVAQDIPSLYETAVPDYATALTNSRLTGRMIRQAQARQRGTRATSRKTGRRAGGGGMDARSIQTCRNARRMDRPAGSRGSAYDRLFRLCRQNGH